MAVINAQCQLKYYFNSTSCVPCPSNCATCESDTNCTQCVSGFHGNICKTPCLENCPSGECHIHYGHCTYGCPDGQFPFENHTGCVSCPENCVMCSSTGICFTCRDGLYGQNCSAMCPSECANRACNQSGTCLQCKEGYYRQTDICLPCPRGCITCENSTHCSSCDATHVGPFQATCIRRCSKKSPNFISYFNQRCGISLDTISQNQPSCFAVNLKQSYKCITIRSCISCPTEDCNRTKIESHTCLSYESCRTKCNPASNSHIIEDVDGTTRQTLCEEQCSIYHAIGGKKEQTCPSITEGSMTSSEDIECFQESKTAVNSAKDHSTPITVVVVAGCVVVILLIGTVACQHGKSLGRTIRRFWSPEVVLAEESVYRSCGLTSQVKVTTTRHRARTVESGYGTENCSQFATDRRMYVPIPAHRDELQDDTYDKVNFSTFVADDRAYNKNSVPLQRRGTPADTYDKASCSTFVAKNRTYNKNSVPLQRLGIPADTYDKASCSSFVADNRAYNNNSVPLQRLAIPADTYDKASCSTVVADNRAYNNNSVPLQGLAIPADTYDKASCSSFVADNRAYNNNSVPFKRLAIPADTYDKASCSTIVADNRGYNNNSVLLQRRGIPTDMYDTEHCYNVVMEDGLNNTLACLSQKSCVADDDDDAYDYVYFDQSAPVVDRHSEVRKFRPDSADANGYSFCAN